MTNTYLQFQIFCTSIIIIIIIIIITQDPIWEESFKLNKIFCPFMCLLLLLFFFFTQWKREYKNKLRSNLVNDAE